MIVSDVKGKLIHFLKPKNKKRFWTVFGLLLCLGITVGGFAHAAVLQTIGDYVLSVINWLLQYLVWFLAVILTKLFSLVIVISAYNDFFNMPSVEKGWILVRDLCNMFIVVILLVIAFANIFRIESYSIKKTLPKLVFSAVAINFSKLICGLIIDFGQVVMLTFVNGYKAVSAFNLVSGLQLQKYITPVNTAVPSSESGIFLSQGLAVLLLIASVGAMFLLLALLLVRIIYLWFLIVMSPIGFAAGIIPATKKYSGLWWDYFTKYVAVGPILAFFLWLSLFTMANLATGESQMISADTQAALDKYNTEMSAKGANPGESEVALVQNFANVAIAIAMLYVGFFLAAQTSGYAGKLVGSVRSKVTGAMMVTSGAAAVKKLANAKELKGLATKGAKAVARPVWRVSKKPLAAAAKGLTAPIRSPLATLAAAKRAGKAKLDEVRAAGGGAGKVALAAVAGAVVGGLGKTILTSALDGWRTAGLKDKAVVYKEKNKAVDEKVSLYRDGKLPAGDVREIANNLAAPFADRVAAIITLAKNKELTVDDRSTVQELKKDAESSILYKNPVIADSLKDEVVKGGAAHIYYDLADNEQRSDLVRSAKKGKIKYSEQGKEAHEDREFDTAMLEAFGVERYVKEKEKFAEQSVDNETVAQKSLEGVRDRSAVDPAKAVDVEKICSAIFRMSGDLQSTFTYNGSLQVAKMDSFVRSMSGKDVDKLEPAKLDFTPDQLTKRESPAVSLVQNIKFDSLTKAANMEVKEKVINAIFNEQIHSTIAAHPTTGKIDAEKLEDLQEKIFASRELNQMVPDAARAKVEARRDAKRAAKKGGGKRGGRGGAPGGAGPI